MPFTYTYAISHVVKIMEMNEGGNKNGTRFLKEEQKLSKEENHSEL